MRTISLIIMLAGFKGLTSSPTLINKYLSNYFFFPKSTEVSSPMQFNDSTDPSGLAWGKELSQAIKYAEENGFSPDYLFLIDMRIASGKKRFFVFNINDFRVECSGLVAHGNCNTHFLEGAKFSNTPNCGCSSMGKYKVGPSYFGEFGKSYRLYGLDSTNSNAFRRGIVLHGFDPVPDHEIYPEPLCNSFGCPMVNRSFLNKLSAIIDKSTKPVLLWIYE